MIIVTGAAGFIGSNLLAELEESGEHHLVAVDWFGNDRKWLNVRKRELSAIVEPDDLPAFLARSEGKVRAVFHMGAISATTEGDVDLLVERNINYSIRLLDWCTAAHVPMIYASSAATYGAGERGFHDDEHIEALAALRPLNPYAWSKHLVDRVIARRVAEGDPTPPQLVGLKFFNVYGPNEFHKGDMRSVALQLFQAAEAGEPLRLFKSHREGVADGGQQRDFIYVKDCTQVMVWFMKNPAVSGLFNVGSGKARSFLDIAKSVQEALDRHLYIQFVDMPLSIRERYQYFTEADISKLRNAGYSATFFSLEGGILDYVKKYLCQYDSFR